MAGPDCLHVLPVSITEHMSLLLRQHSQVAKQHTMSFDTSMSAVLIFLHRQLQANSLVLRIDMSHTRSATAVPSLLTKRYMQRL